MAKRKPQIFIASSAEGLEVAYALQDNLEYDAECTVWNQGVFDPTSYAMVDLIEDLDRAEYGIFVFSPDDTVLMREEKRKVARDNVILELGLFMGALGREKCFIVTPKNNENLHFPSDLSGIMPLSYNSARQDKNMHAALGPVANAIRKKIRDNNPIGGKLTSKVKEQVSAIGLSAFYSSRNDYKKYRGEEDSIDKYINRAQESICMVSITLSSGILSDDVGKIFKEKLENNKDFKVTVSLLNPFEDQLYQAMEFMFGQTSKTLQASTIDALKSLVSLRESLTPDEQKRFIIKVHRTLPFGSAIILDGDLPNGTIQIETKPYGVGMRKSFAFEISNNDGEFYETLKTSYCKLIDDGICANELPLK